MQLPSAGEVDDLQQQFLSQRSQSDQAVVNIDRQREELQAFYPEALALAVDICDTVEFFYRKDPEASSRRAKCEHWGVVYVADAEPATPAPPPTLPPA